MDADGYLRVEGRLKDMIIRGGENIYPREIEDVLFRAPGGRRGRRRGQARRDVGRDRRGVRPAPAADTTEADLHAHCRAHLAAYKTPPDMGLRRHFPLTASGKIRKNVLRESLADG